MSSLFVNIFFSSFVENKAIQLEGNVVLRVIWPRICISVICALVVVISIWVACVWDWGQIFHSLIHICQTLIHLLDAVDKGSPLLFIQRQTLLCWKHFITIPFSKKLTLYLLGSLKNFLISISTRFCHYMHTNREIFTSNTIRTQTLWLGEIGMIHPVLSPKYFSLGYFLLHKRA